MAVSKARIGALRARLGVAEGATPDGLLTEECAEGAFDGDSLAGAARVLAGGTVTDQRRAQTIARWLDADHQGRTAGFAAYRRAYFGQNDAPLQRLITRKLGDAHPDAAEALGVEQTRIGAVTDRWNAARVAESSAALIEIAARHLSFYGAEKTRHAVLDYGDQIALSRSLLALEGIAPWVLYKLDGGLDHLLIDEAQDTSPTQWAVIAALAEEFFAGEGARAAPRTLFAVGDEKQSIFSFQGADARALTAAHRQFRGRAKAAGRPWKSLPLAESFRSTGAVLAAVDAVFAQPAARRRHRRGDGDPPSGPSRRALLVGSSCGPPSCPKRRRKSSRGHYRSCARGPTTRRRGSPRSSQNGSHRGPKSRRRLGTTPGSRRAAAPSGLATCWCWCAAAARSWITC